MLIYDKWAILSAISWWEQVTFRWDDDDDDADDDDNDSVHFVLDQHA
jgi:hypothetical protein